MARFSPSRRTSRSLVAGLALAGLVAAAAPAAMAIPNTDPTNPGGGGIQPPLNVPPTARVTATPNPVVVPPPLVAVSPTTGTVVQALRLGTLVTFNAGASTDLDGSITKYEWDLDGQPGYETTTTTPTTTRRYGAPGLFPGTVRVTDNRGAKDTASVSVRAHYAPSAKITQSATAAIPGQSVTLNGAGSSDADGIVKYEWDLNGDGTFEATGVQQTTSFPTVGPRTVSLRVTDGLGATSVARASVKVHRAPTALVVSRPVTPAVNQAVILDASHSSDDGSIAKYEWDLNGDNTFETTTTTPTTTTVFATAGAKKVGLRVTDNDGAADTTALNLQVSDTPVAQIDRVAPKLRPSARSLKMTATGRVSFRVKCPASEQICTVSAQLRGTKGALRGRTLARVAKTVQGGRSATLTLPLNRRAKLAVSHRRVAAQLVLSVRDGSGNRAITRTAVTVRR